MNLDALKNMDVNDLLEKLKGQSHLLKDKKLLTKVGLGLGSILIFLIIYYGFVNPLVQEQNIKLAEMNENKNNITTFGESQEQQNNQQDPNAPQVEYFKIPVAFEIQGNYLGYLKFRRALSKSNKVINFDNEKITVNDKGGISSKGTLSIVGLPGQYDK